MKFGTYILANNIYNFKITANFYLSQYLLKDKNFIS